MGFAQNSAVTLENNNRIKRQRRYLDNDKEIRLFSDQKKTFNIDKYGSTVTIELLKKKEVVQGTLMSTRKYKLIWNTFLFVIISITFFSLCYYLNIEFMKFISNKI